MADQHAAKAQELEELQESYRDMSEAMAAMEQSIERRISTAVHSRLAEAEHYRATHGLAPTPNREGPSGGELTLMHINGKAVTIPLTEPQRILQLEEEVEKLRRIQHDLEAQLAGEMPLTKGHPRPNLT